VHLCTRRLVLRYLRCNDSHSEWRFSRNTSKYKTCHSDLACPACTRCASKQRRAIFEMWSHSKFVIPVRYQSVSAVLLAPAPKKLWQRCVSRPCTKLTERNYCAELHAWVKKHLEPHSASCLQCFDTTTNHLCKQFACSKQQYHFQWMACYRLSAFHRRYTTIHAPCYQLSAIHV
jgi:hypothetical protein